MPIATVRGARINYEVLGDAGPWMALSPGGRRAMGEVRYLAERMAKQGYRVLIHDRRNCGASDVILEAQESEYEVWCEDLFALLGQLDALPAIVGGTSSGCRLALMMALRHPEAVRALLLWRVTGSAFSANHLAEQYYGQYAREAAAGGMAAVCETEHFRDRIADNPANREKIMAMEPKRFIASMDHWASYFRRDADLPVIGASEADLRSIKVPTCIVPGNDRVHSRQIGEAAHRFMPGSELHVLMTEDLDEDVGAPEGWHDIADAQAATYGDFLRRMQGRMAA
jgi:pimeloyl-ACP methyl ester carboxylesterase